MNEHCQDKRLFTVVEGVRFSNVRLHPCFGYIRVGRDSHITVDLVSFYFIFYIFRPKNTLLRSEREKIAGTWEPRTITVFLIIGHKNRKE